MCLDLMLEEYGDAVVPGPRRSGPDGGFDGSFDGTLAGYRGQWKIACAVRQDVRQLEKKIDDERGKGPKRTFDSLLIMTPLDLNAPTVKQLGQRAGKGIKRGVVWARARLDRLVRKHPWIASQYFNHDLLPGFVPLQTSQIAEIAGQQDLPLIGREDDLKAVSSFLANGQSVLLILAPGGAGKSRFLRALSELSKNSTPRRSPWARRPDIGTIEEGLKGNLPVGSPLLIALDDAGRVLPEARKLAFASKNPNSASLPDIKVVLAAREVDRDALETMLASLGDVTYSTHNLSPLTLRAAAEVAELEFPALLADDALRLARHFGSNLFLLRTAAQFVRNGRSLASIVDERALRNLVAAAFLKEAEQHLAPSAPQSDVRQILLEAALDVPLTVKGCSSELMILREAGLFRVVGTTLRFRADVEGDLLLGYFLEQPWARASLENQLSRDTHGLLIRVRNLAAAGAGRPAEVVRRVCQSWISQADEVDRLERKAILQMLPHCTRSAPDLAVELCLKYATTLGSHRMDDFGPAVIALARRGHAVDAVCLLRRLAEVGIPDGMYSNYKVAGAAGEIASPAYLRAEQVSAILAKFMSWVQGTMTPSATEILQSALNKLLAPSFNWDTSDGATTSFHEQAVVPGPTVEALRAKTLEVVAAMLVHQDSNVRQVAAAILIEHTRATGGGMVPAAPAMKDLQAAEFRALVPLLERRVKAETEVSVLAGIEEALVFRWASGRPMADEAGRILQSVTWPVLLTAFRLTTRPWEYYFSISEAMRGAPSGDRWSWWIEARGSKDLDGLPMSEVDRVLDALRTELPGPDGLVRVAQALGHAARAEILFDRWCEREPDLFDATLRRPREELSDAARHKLVRARRRATFAAPSFDPIAEVRQRLSLGESLAALEEVCGDFPSVDAATLEELSRLFVETDNVEFRRFGLQLMQYRRDVPRPAAFRIVRIALRDGLWAEAWDSIWSILNEAEAEARADSQLFAAIEERVLEVLQSEDAHLLSNGGYLERILGIMVGDDVELRLGLVGRLVVARNSWLNPTVKLAIPLLKDVDSFLALLRMLGQKVEAKSLNLQICEVFLGRTASEAGMPSGAMTVTERLLEDPSRGVQEVGITAICEMRETALAAEACAFLADLAAQESCLAEAADHSLHRFTTPRNGVISRVGEAPSVYLRMQEMLTEAAAKATRSAARKRLSAMRREVERAIKANLDRDAETIEPR